MKRPDRKKKAGAGGETAPATDPESLLVPAFEGLAALAKEWRPDLDLGAIEQRLKNLRLGIFRLVVMGEVKKGKSSFINALLGEPDLLPTATDVATSTVYKILYGPEPRYKVFFYPDAQSGERKAPQVIPRERLGDFGTETGNPGNVKGVDFIGIELPNQLLKGGLVIVDTPGVGGLFRAHKAITWRYAPNADAIAFVVDSVEAVMSRDEVRFLKDLTAKFTKRIFFVQTKTDAADEEAWKAWRERNLKILREDAGFPEKGILYFPLSARTKVRADQERSEFDLGESGYLPVLDLIQRRLPAIKRIALGGDIAAALLDVAGAVEKELGSREAITSEASKERLAALSGELQQAQARLHDWVANDLPARRSELQGALDGLRRRISSGLRDDLEPEGKVAREFLEEIRRDATNWDAAAIVGRARELQQQLLDRAFTAVAAAQEAQNDEARRMIEDGLGGSWREMDACLRRDAMLVPGGSGGIQVSDIMVLSKDFDTVRGGFFGMSMGAGIAYTGVALISLLIPPLGAVAVLASAVGGWVGLTAGFEREVERQREEALRALGQQFARIMHTVCRKAVEDFEVRASALARAASLALDDMAKAKAEELKRVQAQMQEQMKASKKDAEHSLARIREAKKGVDGIRDDLRLLGGGRAVAVAGG